MWEQDLSGRKRRMSHQQNVPIIQSFEQQNAFWSVRRRAWAKSKIVKKPVEGRCVKASNARELRKQTPEDKHLAQGKLIWTLLAWSLRSNPNWNHHCLAILRSNCKSSISRFKLKSTFVWQLWDQITKVPFEGFIYGLSTTEWQLLFATTLCMYMWNFNKYCMISFSLGWLPAVPSLIRH